MTDHLHKKFEVHDTDSFKAKVLNWLKQFNTFCFLDSNLYTHYKNREWVIGAGVKKHYQSSETHALQGLQSFIDEKPCWLMGHLSYELQTADRPGLTVKQDQLYFPDVFFFEPEILIQVKNGQIEILADEAEKIFDAIANTVPLADDKTNIKASIHLRIPQQEYLQIIESIKKHIQIGDCYEINFCQEFFAENVKVDPFLLYEKLNQISPNPFSALYRLDDKWLLCASPERFLQKRGNIISSQPIKGTLQRTAGNVQKQQQQLLQSEKDKAENVMIVDLVRNDLSRICREGSVKVDELFGVYTFPQVHQMISTISGILNKDVKFSDIINATFPMGSMTGAPKIKVMQLIDAYEKSRRGIFSGSVGYINPSGDFDMNVVIRSLMYNSNTHYLSFQTGGGITAYSDPQKEWEECMIKAKAIKDVLA